MNGFGFSELLVIIILSIILLDAKQVAQAVRWMGSIRTKMFKFQNDLKSQLDTLIEEPKPEAQVAGALSSKYEWRRWGSEHAIQLPSVDKAAAASKALELLKEWDVYKDAKCVAMYSSLGDELDTMEFCKQALADGKTLLLPYTLIEGIYMALIDNLEKDLLEGAYGIQEPSEESRTRPVPPPDLILIPGRCFDSFGGRIGRGKGHYDRYLTTVGGVKVGLCFDGQVAPKKLNLASHDIPMDYLLTEAKLSPRRSQESHD